MPISKLNDSRSNDADVNYETGHKVRISFSWAQRVAKSVTTLSNYPRLLFMLMLDLFGEIHKESLF